MKIILPKKHAHIIFLSLFIGLQGCGGKSNNTATENTIISAQPVVMSDSSPSSAKTATKTSRPPHLVTTNHTTQQVTLTWTAVSKASNYTVYWSNVVPFKPENAVTEQTNKAMFTHQVIPNTTYYYQVSYWLNGEEHPLLKTITTQSKKMTASKSNSQQ